MTRRTHTTISTSGVQFSRMQLSHKDNSLDHFTQIFTEIYLWCRDTSRKYTRTGDMRDGEAGDAREAREAGAEFEAETELETVSGPDVNNGDSPLALDQVSRTD